MHYFLLIENSNNKHGNKIYSNMYEQNLGVMKLPTLVLHRIDQQLKTRGRQALEELENSNSQI